MVNENDWFLPKRFGYGAGMPITWQGWVTIGGFLALTFVAALVLLPKHFELFIIIAMAGAIPLIVISQRHTRGGWKWRWGGDA